MAKPFRAHDHEPNQPRAFQDLSNVEKLREFAAGQRSDETLWVAPTTSQEMYLLGALEAIHKAIEDTYGPNL